MRYYYSNPTEPPHSARVLAWIVSNVLLAWLVSAAVMSENTAAMYTLSAVMWAIAFMTFVVFSHAASRRKARERGRSVPILISAGLGMGFVVVFIWHGWWLCALAMTITEVCEYAIHDTDA